MLDLCLTDLLRAKLVTKVHRNVHSLVEGGLGLKLTRPMYQQNPVDHRETPIKRVSER